MFHFLCWPWQLDGVIICSKISYFTYDVEVLCSYLLQGARKDGRGNEPVGSCAMCDARSTGPRALEGKNRWKMAGQNKIL